MCDLQIDRNVSAKSLLQKALVELNIKNQENFQIWVALDKSNDFYPLFGHEQPYSIQLSNERDTSEADNSLKCQFILRESKQIKNEQKKSKKKRFSEIFRKFTDKSPTSPRSESVSEWRLFGRDLSEICNPSVPEPIMELLEKLFNVGPYTMEIFRKPSNAKKCQEMVNLINSAEPDRWSEGCNNGILLASILKTFLKELPGFLLCSSMYYRWTEALNVTDDEECILTIKQILEQIPRGNYRILRYVICILRHVADKSEENKMTSSNLAICLGPSLLWTDLENGENDAATISKTVPVVVQYLIDKCTNIFGDDILNEFGHDPTPPSESDTEDRESSDTLQTPFHDSLESLSDNDTVMNSLTQMSPSSCSRDSGLILSDPHEENGEHSDDHSLPKTMVKSKSCESLSTHHMRLHGSLLPLQTQVSSDSLGCDEEFVEATNDHSYLLKKSSSGIHLCYEKRAENPRAIPPNSMSRPSLKDRLAAISSRYPHSQGDTSSDSDSNLISKKEETKRRQDKSLHKSSTSSSLQRGSSSSDETYTSAGYEIQKRHIGTPRILESSSGHQPTDFLKQFTKKIESQEAKKKNLQMVMAVKTDPSTYLDSANHRWKQSHSTNMQGRLSDSSIYENTVLHRSMPDQRTSFHEPSRRKGRPSHPPSYNEACERNGLFKPANVSEIEKIKQIAMSTKAKQLYTQSLKLFEQENNSAVEEKSSYQMNSNPLRKSDTLPDKNITNDNNNTIGVKNTNNETYRIKRVASASSSTDMFYQPQHTLSIRQNSSQNSLSSSFYRPSRPPPYNEAMQGRAKQPNIIDSLGGESLV